MELYLIRHAQSENNAEWAAHGTDAGRKADPAITALGHQQAQHLAEYLAAGEPDSEPNYFARRHNRGGFGLTHLYTSLMIRSVATAGYVAKSTGLPLLSWADVHERGGLHEKHPETDEEIGVSGPNRDYFAAEFPELVLPPDLGATGWWDRPMEHVEESYPRAMRVWEELIERHGGTDDRVAVVSHGGFFQSLMVTLLGTDQEDEWQTLGLSRLWFGMSNTAISRIVFTDGYGVISYLNRVDHLPSELITG